MHNLINLPAKSDLKAFIIISERIYGNPAHKIKVFFAVFVDNITVLRPIHNDFIARIGVKGIFIAYFNDFFAALH